MPPLRPAGIQQETPIPITSVTTGDMIYINLKAQLALAPHVTITDDKNKEVVWQVVVMTVSRTGYYATQVQGIVSRNDTTNFELRTNVGGRHAYRSSLIGTPAAAIIPYGTIQAAYIERPRFDEHGNQNVKFPRKIPIDFNI